MSCPLGYQLFFCSKKETLSNLHPLPVSSPHPKKRSMSSHCRDAISLPGGVSSFLFTRGLRGSAPTIHHRSAGHFLEGALSHTITKFVKHSYCERLPFNPGLQPLLAQLSGGSQPDEFRLFHPVSAVVKTLNCSMTILFHPILE